MSKFAAFVKKAVAFARSSQGKRDIALFVAAAEAAYQAAKQAGIVG